MAILTACGSSADNSQKQETIVKQPEATSMTVESDENVSETNDTSEYTKIVNNETSSIRFDNLDKLSRILNVPIGDLFYQTTDDFTESE